MHTDKHVVKMILESCQLLSTVAREKYKIDAGYKSGWKNHPCTAWVAKRDANFWWLFQLAMWLCDEYTFRYGKHHKSEETLKDLSSLFNIIAGRLFVREPSRMLSMPYLAMPDDCKTNDPVQSYRNYYLKYKQHLLTYTRREIPFWIKEAGLGTWKEAKI